MEILLGQERVREKLTVDSLSTDTRWKKYSLDANFINKVRKNISLILTEKTSEGTKNAVNELEKNFVDKYAVASWKEQRTLISLFGLVCKYFIDLLSSEDEALERIHLVRVLINTAIVISKEKERFRTSALWKINQHVPFLALFNTFGDNIEFLRLVPNFYITRRRAFRDDDEQVIEAMIKQLPLVDSTTQGCLVAAGTVIVNNSVLANEDSFNDLAIQLLNAPDPSLGKLMVALYLPAKQDRGDKENRVTLDHESDFIKVLAEYVNWCDEYEAAVKESSLNICLTIRIASRVIEDLKSHEQSFLEQSINNLKQLKNESAMHYAVELLVYFVFFEPRLPGTKVIDLPDMATILFTELVTIDHIWNNQQVRDTLAKHNLPNTHDAMVRFIRNTSVSEGLKRFPTFDTVSTVPWSTLNYSYGTAEDIPDSIRSLASWDSEIRRVTLTGLINGITHQGQCYDVTPYVIPFLLELVEATLVQDKHKVMEFCTNMLTDRVDYFLTNIVGLDLSKAWGPYPEILQIRLQIEKQFTENLTRIIQLLTNDSTDVRGWAVYLLGLLPKSASQSIPKLRERYDIETDSKVKASILVSLSLLWPHVDEDRTSFTQLLHHEYERYKGTDALDMEFAAFASLVRLQEFDGEFGKNMKREFKKLLMESEDVSLKRANYVITLPVEFIIRVIFEHCYAELLPYVMEQVQSDEWGVFLASFETMFKIAFRSAWYCQKRKIHSEISSPEQIMVVTKCLEKFDSGSLWSLQELGLPYDKESCQEYLEEARVIEDLYG